MKILFKYPSRGREARFFDSLNTIYSNIADQENFHVCATLDTDDEVMNRLEVKERLAQYKNLSVAWGLSDSKVHAINRDFPRYDFDIVVCWSDDMMATFYGFDDVIRGHMQEAFPDMDGLLHFPDQDAGEALNTLFISTKKYYDRFGYIYHPSYKSLWCDNETMLVAKILERYRYYNFRGLFQHLNPAYGHLPRDPMFDAQQNMWGEDEANFNARKAINFEL